MREHTADIPDVARGLVATLLLEAARPDLGVVVLYNERCRIMLSCNATNQSNDFVATFYPNDISTFWRELERYAARRVYHYADERFPDQILDEFNRWQDHEEKWAKRARD
jgi:hypothetical protein